MTILDSVLVCTIQEKSAAVGSVPKAGTDRVPVDLIDCGHANYPPISIYLTFVDNDTVNCNIIEAL